MAELTSKPAPSVFNLSSVLRAIFRHKGKVLLLTLLGLLGAVGVYLFYPSMYVSQAKLLVRYVIERSGVDPTDGTGDRDARLTDAVINSEAEILSSWDLAMQTANTLGAKKVLPHASNPTTEEAAVKISRGLDVGQRKGSNILFVSYQDRNAEVAPEVLNELITRYFIKHLEVHRSAGAFDFVTQQTDQVRAQLNQTEDALRPLREKAGIVSLASGTAALDTELAKTQDQLHDTEAELAEEKARVEQLNNSGAVSGNSALPTPTPTATVRKSIPPSVGAAALAASPSAVGAGAAKPLPGDSPTPTASNTDLLQYQSLLGQLDQLHHAEGDLRARYTPENTLVKNNQHQIDDLEKKRLVLETKFPDLPMRARGQTAGRPGEMDPLVEKTRLAGVEARAVALRKRLAEVQEQIKRLSELRPQIAELERKEDLEEANYKYFQATLEKARIDEALDPSKMPNISAVQKASPPALDTTKRNKLAGGLAAGGLIAGIALALLLDLILDRTVKRGTELEGHLGAPLLLSIPWRGSPDRPLLSFKRGSNTVTVPTLRPNGTSIAPWDAGHFIRPYTEAIRDRLNLYFERHQLTHKPKLIGVAGLSEGVGTSTLAAGLAAALSEVHDGKVLLVDVKLGPGDVHPFFKGRPALSLPAAINSSGPDDSAAENLFLATVGSNTQGLAQLGLKKFFEMMPNLKASDFDYVIFDMPPLVQTSPTLGMSAFMDQMLLVVEAEKTNRDVIKRNYDHLVRERKNVSVVLNKARSYTPRWLDGIDPTEE